VDQRLTTSAVRVCLATAALVLAACARGDGPLAPEEPPTLTNVSPAAVSLAIETGQTIAFQVAAATASGHAATVEFRVDGAAVAQGERFSFAPPAPGTYVVEAIASSGAGRTSHTWTVTVTPANLAPTADLDVTPRTGSAPLGVHVTLTGADPDGAPAHYRLVVTGPAPLDLDRSAPIDTVLTLTEGSWTVRGSVQDDAGASSGEISVPVTVAAHVNLPPVPALSVEPTQGAAPLDVLIRAAGSDPDGSVVRYELDMDGDGSFELDATVPLVQGARYLAPGSRWIRMRLTDDAGVGVRDSVLVTVTPGTPPPPAPPPGGNSPPEVSLSATPTSGVAPLSVTASAAGHDADGQVVSLSLDFDADGVPEAAAADSVLQASHVYAQPGTYTLRASGTDDLGAVGTRTMQISVADPNQPPTGTISATATRGDAPLGVQLSFDGQDPDGRIVRWEVDDDRGGGFQEVTPGTVVSTSYDFRDTAYAPRLRVTDDDGAVATVQGPAIRVSRPIDPAFSGGSAQGNPHFDPLATAPAIWADGQDVMRFSVIVRDHAGDPLADVPVRVRSLRPELVAPDGAQLGGTTTIALDGTRSDASGRVTGGLTTHTSTRVERVPSTGQFAPFDLMVEADAGHGEWRRLPDIRGLNAETIVDGTAQVGRFYVTPQGRTCVGQPIDIHVKAVRRSDAPGAGGPAGGEYTEVRLTTPDAPVIGTPLPGYGAWRTDGAGEIVFHYVPQQEDHRALRAWVDGQPLSITAALAVFPAPCP